MQPRQEHQHAQKGDDDEGEDVQGGRAAQTEGGQCRNEGWNAEPKRTYHHEVPKKQPKVIGPMRPKPCRVDGGRGNSHPIFRG